MWNTPHPLCANSQAPGWCQWSGPKSFRFLAWDVGVALASLYNEHHVFRAAVVSIVLTLVIGQNTAPLCRAWCDSMAAAETRCHHHDAVATSVSTVGDVACDMAVRSALGFLREELQRGASSHNAQHAILIPCDPLAHVTVAARLSPDPGLERSPRQRTLPTVLRL